MTMALTESVVMEIRRIASELETFPYVARTWNWLSGRLDGNAAGGHADIVPGCGGAVVYHDVISEGGHGTRTVVREVADRVILGAALRTRCERETAAALEQVARLRLSKSSMVSHPELPPSAGLYYLPAPIRDRQVSRRKPEVSRRPSRGNVYAVVVDGLSVKEMGMKAVRQLRRPVALENEKNIEYAVGYARAAWRAALDASA